MSVARLLGFVLVFDALAILILYPRIDIFSGGYLLLSTALAALQAVVNQQFSKSIDIQRFFYAKDIDQVWDRWIPLLGLAEFAVFFEYAHERIIPALLNLSAQVTGLLLCLAGTVWLLWVDSYLIENFPSHYRRGAFMISGPYRYVRHPRYMGLLATRCALPFLFGSVIACLLTVIWFLLIRRRARLEEQYLRGKFGEAYSQYARHAIRIP